LVVGELHRLVLIGILSRGNILFEGLPGLGKTALVRTIGQISSWISNASFAVRPTS